MNDVNRLANSASRFPAWLLLLALLTALGPLSIDMYLPALTNIEQGLNAVAGSAGMTLSSFFIGMALGQLLYGPVSDAFGRKLPLYIGIVIFVIASIGCALAQSMESLVIWRGIQALGACAGGVVSRAIVRDRCTPVETAQAFSLLLLVMGLAPILSPSLGGILLLWFDWRALFVLLVIVGLISLACVHWGLQETLAAPKPLSLRSIGADYAALLRDREFMLLSIAGGFSMAAMFSYIVGSPFVFIELHQLSPQQFSLLFGSCALAMILFSQLNSRLVRRWHMAQLLLPALVVAVLALLLLIGLALWAAAPWWSHWLMVLLFMASLGFVAPNTAALALAKQGARAGTASALMGALQFTVAGIASAIIGAWHDGSALPMAAVMFSCSLFALMCCGAAHHKSASA